MLLSTCQMFNLWMKWPDCTSHHENHRAPYQSPFTIYTHGHTQLVEPLELQTDSRGYLWTARTNIHFIFVPTTSSNNMLMSAFSMSRLRQSDKAKNCYTLGLTVSRSSKRLQVRLWCTMKTDDKVTDTNFLSCLSIRRRPSSTSLILFLRTTVTVFCCHLSLSKSHSKPNFCPENLYCAVQHCTIHKQAKKLKEKSTWIIHKASQPRQCDWLKHKYHHKYANISLHGNPVRLLLAAIIKYQQ